MVTDPRELTHKTYPLKMTPLVTERLKLILYDPPNTNPMVIDPPKTDP